MTVHPILIMSNIIVDDLWLADGTHFPATLGGAATYAAVGAALWWSEVAIVAGVGSDLAAVTGGKLEGYGLRPEGHLVRSPHTIQSKLVYLPDGQRTETPSYGRAHFESLQVGPSDVPAALLPAAGTYIFRDLEPRFWEGVRARRAELGTILWEVQEDAALPELWEQTRANARLVDLLSLNRFEASRLLGTDDPDEILDHLMATGLKAVALRLGAEGALIATPHARLRLRPPPSDVVDVTGGGNAFCGGFLAGWILAGGDVERAARCAAGSAAHALTQYGPRNPKDRDDAVRWSDKARLFSHSPQGQTV